MLQTYRAASASVSTAASGRQANSWAVVLDADETVISNLQYQIERAEARQPYTPESWRAWVGRGREATPLPGAAAFLAHVRALSGRIAIVTNRLQSECPDTEALFKTHKLVYDVMLCRPDGGRPTRTRASPRRRPARRRPVDHRSTSWRSSATTSSTSRA